MSAFCVSGMTEPIARKAAAKAWEKHLTTMTKEVRACLTDADEKAWIEVRTEYLLAKAKAVQVSGAFDAPPVRRRLHRAHATHASHLPPPGNGARREKGRQRRAGHQQVHQKPVIGWVPFSS